MSLVALMQVIVAKSMLDLKSRNDVFPDIKREPIPWSEVSFEV